MQYGDEKIIAERVAQTEREQLSIAKQVKIDGTMYEFSNRVICDKFCMKIPNNFEVLPAELAAIKYPSANRPEVIFSSPDTTVDIFFTCGEKETDTIKDRITHNKLVVKKLNPSYVFTSIKAGSKLAYFDFRSHALDDDIYNLWFLADLPESTISGGFSCPTSVQSQWQALALQMLQTIAVLPRK